MKKYKRNIIVLVATIIGLCSLFYVVIYRNWQKNMSTLQTKYDTIEARVNKTERNLKSYEKLNAEIDSLASAWYGIEASVPEVEGMPELLREIASAGENSKVDFVLSKPLSPIEHKDYFESPLQIKVKCGYHQLGSFLSRLARLRRHIDVKKLELSSYNNVQEPYHTVEASFIASAYAMGRGQND